MPRPSKCEACMKEAEEIYQIHKLSKYYCYQLLREKCTHTLEEQTNRKDK